MNRNAVSSGFLEVWRNSPLLAACTVGFGLGLSGIPFYTLGVFVDPLHEAFGWTVGQVQLGLTISYLTTMLVLPVIGLVSNKVGVRFVAISSLVLLGVAFMGLSLQNGDLRLYYLNWFFIALFGTGTLAITWTRAITNTFRTGRGLALGLSLFGTGIVGIFGPSIARYLISAVGWRQAFLCLGAGPLLVAAPIAVLFFRDKSSTVAGLRGAAPPYRNRYFLTLAATFLLLSVGITGLVPNLIKIFTSEGLSRTDAILAVSVVGAFVVLGRLTCGALIDRFWAPAVAVSVIALSGASCVLLATGGVYPATAVLSAALIGLTVGAEFDLMPFLISRYLPTQYYTSALAVVSSCFYLGAAVSAPTLAFFFDAYGSYKMGLWGSIIMLTTASILLWSLGPYPQVEQSLVD